MKCKPKETAVFFSAGMCVRLHPAQVWDINVRKYDYVAAHKLVDIRLSKADFEKYFKVVGK